MLGRTANGIFWMFRYLERAENSARLLDAGFRLALMRGSRTDQEEWRSVLTTLGLQSKFAAAHAETSRHAVTNFILRERDNPGSVLNMVEHARNNARGVRTAITREVWEATNECWMELKQLLARPVRAREFFTVLSAIRRHATLVRGAMEETMLRNEIYSSPGWAHSWNAPTTPRGFSMSNIMCCCQRSAGSAPTSTMCNGKPCCARYRASAPIAGLTLAGSIRAGLPGF